MHEFAITQSIVDVAIRTAEQHQARRLLEVHVSIGSLTGIVEESLRFYFEAISRGTLAEGACLIVHPQLALAACPDCGHSTPVDPPFTLFCPRCGSDRVRVHGGDALVVERVEISLE